MFYGEAVSNQNVNRMFLAALHSVIKKHFISCPTVSTYLFPKSELQIFSPRSLVSVASLVVFSVTLHDGNSEITLPPIHGNILVAYAKVMTPISAVVTGTHGIEAFLAGCACALQECPQCFRDGQVLTLRFAHVLSFPQSLTALRIRDAERPLMLVYLH